MLNIIALFLGAFFNRVRGGMADQYYPNNGVPNVLWKGINAVAFGSFIGFALHSWYVIPCAALGMFIGGMFEWPWLNLLQEHIQVKKNLFYAALRGLVWTIFIAGSIYYFDHRVLHFIPVGIFFGIPYYLFSFIDEDKARAWSEYAWGGIMWGSLILTINNGV